MTTTFTGYVLIDIAGVEEEYEVRISGQYVPADKGDPWGRGGYVIAPEGEAFELDEVVAHVRGKAVNLVPLLSDKQLRCLELEGLTAYANDYSYHEEQYYEALREERALEARS